MKNVCVFAGSTMGDNPAYRLSARELGRELVRCELGLVYGGSQHGLMGEVADAVLQAGGRVTGVMPVGLFSREVAHAGLTELIEVDTMHERKAMMSHLADAFIALPGGVGTFDELFEAICWAQLGIHRKPVGLLSVAGYYAPLLTLVDHAMQAGFVQPANRSLWLCAADAATLLDQMRAVSGASAR